MADHPQGAGEPHTTSAGQVRSRCPDHHLDVPRLDDPLELPVRVGGPVGVDAEGHVDTLARREPDAGEPGELLHRAGDLGEDVAQVELDHLVALPRARVADADRDSERAVGGHLGIADA
jgi:hypothetical protein